MAQTEHYGFYLNDDPSMYFLEWRNQINGTVDSNFKKLDEILADKEDKRTYVNVTLKQDGWTDKTQAVEVEGLGAAQLCGVVLCDDVSTEEYEAVRLAMLEIVRQADGELTFAAYGDVPSIDIPIRIVLFH